MSSIESVKIEEIEYRGYKIKYDIGYNEGWRIDGEDQNFSSPMLSKIIEKIDEIEKKEFARFEVYYESWRDKAPRKLTVTSMCDNYAWTKDSSGRREKVKLEYLIEDTPRNLEVLGKINSIKEQINTLRETQDKLGAELTRVKQIWKLIT